MKNKKRTKTQEPRDKFQGNIKIKKPRSDAKHKMQYVELGFLLLLGICESVDSPTGSTCILVLSLLFLCMWMLDSETCRWACGETIH